MGILLTAKKIRDLNRMNMASLNAGGIGSILVGDLALPDAGTLEAVQIIRYNSAPVLGTATRTHAAVALTASPQTITTAITNPDVPRIVTVKGNASGIAGDVVITGTDFNDDALTETIALNGATEVLGTKAFKTVTSIALPVETNAGTDTVSVGVGNKVGLPLAMPNASNVIAKTFNGAVDAGTVTANAVMALSLYAPAGTLDGTKVLALTFTT